MKTIVQRTSRIAGVMALFLCLFMPTGTSAHGTEVHSETSAETTSAATSSQGAPSYSFIARKGDSLTVLARRALQLYQADNKITLEAPAAVYCETAVAQALGGGYLEIGQRVDIPVAALKAAIDSSKTLTARQIETWRSYASNVSFDVSGVEVVTTETATDSSNNGTEAGGTEASDESETAQTDGTAPEASSKAAGGYWWWIGAAALVAIYFVLGGPAPRIRKR